ncbi:hypothetical protein A2397_05660 [Candidatus Amesbacteria bacterium RIFOXYB1_FULL_44_23]|uniref:Zinc finger DksA/TraR C4-type domain-containing protein n=1 Tax=Candidatus Amesbacteria bacterium RIFOXYB1_FULL_44_23 TaxID=1797263 RepID=A0A1F4ZQU5_9BACT|nr:MAG: hypothetical protein A2397_05660 [Candidatus Amesbacteria bacterium RIFOXYB1_FULL_44_23]
MDKKNNVSQKLKFLYPSEVLKPVREYLSGKLFGLEKRKQELVTEDPYYDKSRLDDNAAIDADAAERVGHMEVSALRRAMDKNIIQVRKALSRIKFGKYGICEKCAKMIDTDRLMVFPETTICITCERKREK